MDSTFRKSPVSEFPYKEGAIILSNAVGCTMW